MTEPAYPMVLTAPSAALVLTMQATATELTAALPVLPLGTPDQVTRAKALLRAIATLRAKGEVARKAEKEPSLRASQAVDAEFKGPDKALAEVDRQLRRRIGEVEEAADRARTEALALAARAAQAGDAQAANAAMILADDPVFQEVAKGVSTRWTWEPVSVTLAQVPLDYLAVDMVKVKAEIASAVRAGREPVIPGIAFEKRADLTVRRLP